MARKFRKNKEVIADSLLTDKSGNIYLCRQPAAYASGELIHFEPRIDDYIIELKHLVDVKSFEVIEYPVFKDKSYFYTHFKMQYGGTVTVFESNKENILKFRKIVDSIRLNK